MPIDCLAEEPLLSLPRDTPARRLLERACQAGGFKPKIKAESHNASTIVAMSRSGRGIPVVLDYVLASVTAEPGTPIVDGMSDFRLPVWLYWRKGATLGAAVSAFVTEARTFRHPASAA